MTLKFCLIFNLIEMSRTHRYVFSLYLITINNKKYSIIATIKKISPVDNFCTHFKERIFCIFHSDMYELITEVLLMLYSMFLGRIQHSRKKK